MTFDPADIVSKLTNAVEGVVQADMSLAPFTSYNIGGPTAVFAAPETEAGIKRVLDLAHADDIPLFVLGRGSNVLVSDKGWQGVTLYLGDNTSGWEVKGQDVQVQAGTRLLDLIRAAVGEGLAGMEMLAGIPGGIGGALRMNAGAFGQEIESVTRKIEGYRLNGRPFQAMRDDIDFSYRRAPVLDDVVITSACFHFDRGNRERLEKRVEEVLSMRARKQPLNFPSCGSVFKRPPGYYAGALIEEAGLKGERIGGAEVSRKHSGFILNVANAQAADVYALIRRIEQRIFEKFGVQLVREVELVGDFGDT